MVFGGDEEDEPRPHDIETTEDAFLGGRLIVRQPSSGLRAGLDAVLLAASVDLPDGAHRRVLDAGAGSGIVGLAIATRCVTAHVTSVEIDTTLARLAQENARRNGLADRIHVITADVMQPPAERAMLGLAPESFDEVVANPPFFDMARVRLPREERRARAMALAEGDLDRWLRFLTTMAKPGGRLTLIHRAEGLGALLSALQGRFGKLSVFPVFSRVGLPAHRILVSGIKGSRGGVELRRGLVVHADDGTITAAAESVLRHGARLDWEAA